MPSWSDLVKQKPMAKATKVGVNNDLSVKSEPITFEYDYGLKNEEEEFDFKYGDTLLDIAIEFRDFLEQSLYPIFPNNKLTLKLQDYMKYYCHNYERVIQEVDNYNDELEKEMDELENEEK